MTSARRAAIKKAQAASARKRRGRRNKKIAAGVGLASVGVIGITMAASRSRKRGAVSKTTPVNVVQNTVHAPAPEQKLSTSKELDIIRVTLDSPGVIKRTPKGKYAGIDFSHVGKEEGSQSTHEHKTQRQRRAQKKLNLHIFGKGKIRVAGNGTAIKVKRDRQGFNEDRRNTYSPSARRKLYENQKAQKAKKSGKRRNG